MPKQIRLPSCLPAGSKYVIDSRCRNKNCMVMHRYVELSDGHRVEFAPRLLPIKGSVARSLKGRRCLRGSSSRR
jgi:hypothetical protein